jgi:DNA polymerase-3 subunit delta'
MVSSSPILGHAQQRSELLTDLESGNVAHAYLFAGPPHVGKLTVAKWFAKELILQGVVTSDRERVAHEVDRLIHPDILILDQLWIEEQCEDFDVIARSSNIPQQHRSRPPAMRTDVISIDDVRIIQERLYETGTGRYRCCLIRSVERLREEAANAFLKILEEPPPGRVFLLTTQSLSSVIPTLRSRTRVLPFQHVPLAEIRPLVEGLPEDEARFLLHRAQGQPGIIHRLRDDPDALREERLAHTQAISFWSTSSLSERLGLLAPLKERGEASDRLLLHLGLALREDHGTTPPREQAWSALCRGLSTNAHRELLLQRFAMHV